MMLIGVAPLIFCVDSAQQTIQIAGSCHVVSVFYLRTIPVAIARGSPRNPKLHIPLNILTHRQISHCDASA